MIDTLDPLLFAHVRAILTTPSPLTKFSPGRHQVEGDIVLTEIGQGAGSRHVIVLGPVPPQEVLARAVHFFAPNSVGSVELVAETAPEMGPYLLNHGWVPDGEEPALVLPRLPEIIPVPPPELAVRVVADAAGLRDFRSIASTPERFLPSLEAATAPGVFVLTGHVDGAPVATSRVSVHGDVAEIMGVVTHLDWRRRGFGAAMTWAAVGHAAAMGARAFILTATELGYPVYRRMGFFPVCTLHTFVPPAE